MAVAGAPPSSAPRRKSVSRRDLELLLHLSHLEGKAFDLTAQFAQRFLEVVRCARRWQSCRAHPPGWLAGGWPL
jgi:hypothetical protein